MLVSVGTVVGTILATGVSSSLPATASTTTASSGGQVVTSGNARFEVLSPTLIRMQYAGDGQFTTAPTFNAVGRDNFSPTLDAGAVDNAVAGQAAALDALLSASQRAFDQRDAAVAELIRCASAIDELRQLGRLAREIGKHTRLVAFNASIEANRSGNGNPSGAQAVANETRTLAARMAEVGEKIERLVATLDRTLPLQRLRGEIADTTPDELRMELDLRARQALTGLLAGMGGAMHGSAEVKAVSQALSSQLEETFVAFQFGDRLSQMMSIVGNDMQNFARWVAAHPHASQSDAAEWLGNLEASYTMEEQRSKHHGNVHIDRGSEVEFF